ncbi:hypothetical protein WIW50_04895 [Flavobacteriaceae bacterium 3-367]
MQTEKQKKETQKKSILFIVLGVFLFFAFWQTSKKDHSLQINKDFTIGKVTDVHFGMHGFIKYKYYVDGLLFEGSDPDEASWPEYYRTTKPIVGKFYNVEFDSKNPKNSKIIIGKNSHFDYEIPEINGIEITGMVEKISLISENYLDLNISYKIYNQNFTFRSRFHKDSLPCKDYENCLNSKVSLMVAEKYPELNDLYFKSYDRMARRKSKLENK